LVAAIIKKQGKKSTTNTTKKPVAMNPLSLEDIRKLILELIQEQFDKYIAKKDKCKRPISPDPDNDDDNFMDIDLTRSKEISEDSRDLATIEGKINGHLVSVVLDSASNKDLMPRVIANKFGLKTNTDTSYLIRSTTGNKKFSESVEATVTLTPGCSIKTTFIVSDDYPVPEIILGRTTLRRYNYDLFESREHAIISCDGKDFFIPIVPDKNRQ